MVRRILFADNDREFLDYRALCLEERGFDVIRARNPQDAERLLRAEVVHLAILDIRLTDDNDERDVSGLMVARNPEFRTVPKIILTGFQSVSHVREALRVGPEGTPSAVDFVAKHDGVAAMLAAVDEAFAGHVSVNWALRVEVSDGQSLSLGYLARLIDHADVDPNAGAAELDDLLRRLFSVEQAIRLHRLIWQRGGLIALAVFAFVKDGAPQPLIVVCGSAATIRDEARGYTEFAPRAPVANGTAPSRRAGTPHYGALAYATSGLVLDRTVSLHELYVSGPEKAWNTVLASLVNATLSDWSQGPRLLSNDTVDELYRSRLRLNTEPTGVRTLDACVDALLRQSATLDFPIERVGDGLRLRVGGRTVTYPNPARLIARNFCGDRPAVTAITPGWLSGENILTDREQRAWLTDFGQAGLAPLPWNFVTLEAAVRFDWIDVHELSMLRDFEDILAMTGPRFDAGQADARLRKPLRAIQSIRRLAGALALDAAPYQAGLFFHAMHRIAAFDPAERLLPTELARRLHVLLAGAVICGRILLEAPGGAGRSVAEICGIAIDKQRGVVSVDGRAAPMPRQSYELLCYLHDHANELCPRRVIFRHLFQMEFDESDESHVGRLTTAIRRLRERIEADPEKPIYLLTETGRGYRLVC